MKGSVAKQCADIMPPLRAHWAFAGFFQSPDMFLERWSRTGPWPIGSRGTYAEGVPSKFGREPNRWGVGRTRHEAGQGACQRPRMTKRSPVEYVKTSPEIIRLAVMLYARFPLLRRNVEDPLHERSLDVSHETVRYWWHLFGPMFASESHVIRPSPSAIHSALPTAPFIAALAKCARSKLAGRMPASVVRANRQKCSRRNPHSITHHVERDEGQNSARENRERQCVLQAKQAIIGLVAKKALDGPAPSPGVMKKATSAPISDPTATWAVPAWWPNAAPETKAMGALGAGLATTASAIRTRAFWRPHRALDQDNCGRRARAAGTDANVTEGQAIERCHHVAEVALRSCGGPDNSAWLQA